MLTAAAIAAIATVAPAGDAAATQGRIVFQADVGDYPQLFTIKPDGSGLTQVTKIPFSAADAKLESPGAENGQWSPDGTHIMFDTGSTAKTVIAPGPCGPPRVCINVFTITPQGGDLTQSPLAVADFRGQPSYSPDGKRIAVGVDSGDGKPSVHGIFIANADGSHPRRITKAFDGGYDGSSQWSPDGRTLAFTRVRNEHEAAVFTVGVDGNGLKRLTPFSLDAEYPDWSPDGKTIAFETYADSHPGQSANVFTMPAGGGKMTQVTHLSGGDKQAFGPSWAPDGKRLVFHLVGSTLNELFIVDSDGRHVRRLTHLNGKNPSHADWGSRRTG